VSGSGSSTHLRQHDLRRVTRPLTLCNAAARRRTAAARAARARCEQHLACRHDGTSTTQGGREGGTRRQAGRALDFYETNVSEAAGRWYGARSVPRRGLGALRCGRSRPASTTGRWLGPRAWLPVAPSASPSMLAALASKRCGLPTREAEANCASATSFAPECDKLAGRSSPE